eukprot:TRINITY_DN6794_c0_g2_i1.p1 TRINITY_DN6794_c0_g2~~TRINITY_DN6794_c0_g2_i1.p1  ORF type:complete len:630 (+),score=79.72 TRINITY_DN6794_c0_g2_i1:40-1890(+)
MGVQQAIALALRTKPAPSRDASSGLRRCLGLRDVVGFGLGLTIGGGIFVATGEASMLAGPGVALSYLFASLACACSGLCYAEMALLVPSAGSSYSYSYTALGELAAFVAGVVAIVGNVFSGAAVARGWGAYSYAFLAELGYIAPGGFLAFDYMGFSVSPIAFLLVCFVGGMSALGTETISSMNGVVTAISIVLLLIFNGAGALKLDPARWSPFMPSGAAGVFQGAGSVFFSYLGFDCLACLTEEAADTQAVPRGIIITLIIATVLYCGTALVFTGLVTREEIDVGAPLASACKVRGMPTIALFISVAAVGNTLTTVIGSVVGCPRICYVMAQDGLLPSSLANVNSRGVPLAALFWTTICMAIPAGLVEFDALADIVSAGALCNFSFVCCALILMRQQQSSSCIEARDLMPSASESPKGKSAIEAIVVGRGEDMELQSEAVVLNQLGSEETDQANNDGKCSDKIDILEKHPFVVASGEVNGERNTSLLQKLCLYSVVCFGLGVSLRVTLATGNSFAIVLVAVQACVVIALASYLIRRKSSWQLSTSGGLRWPFMPLVPLLGVLMNMLMMSGLTVEALVSAFCVDIACVLFYFAYAGPRSHLSLRFSSASSVRDPKIS